MAALPRGQPVSVLEVGAGTGATTAHLLDALPPGSRYVFTDLGASLVARAEERFAGRDIGFARLDIARPPAGQEIAVGAFDVVVAANVLHRSEEHTSELQSLMRISYAVFCLNKKHTHTATNR